jgi:hypothetical protein
MYRERRRSLLIQVQQVGNVFIIAHYMKNVKKIRYHYITRGMMQDADHQRLRRRPNIGAVGVGHGLGSPQSWPSA